MEPAPLPLTLLRRAGDRRVLKVVKRKLHKQSVRPLVNSFQDLPVGDTEGVGYWALVWPEVLHAVEAGTVKRAVDCVKSGTVKHAKGKETTATLT